jgi:hypothetical protein
MTAAAGTEWQLLQNELSLVHTRTKAEHQCCCQVESTDMYVALCSFAG